MNNPVTAIRDRYRRWKLAASYAEVTKSLYYSMTPAKLDKVAKEATEKLVAEQAQILAEHYLYDTPEGKELLNGLEAAMRKYPVVASDIEQRLSAALSKVVLDHFQKERPFP